MKITEPDNGIFEQANNSFNTFNTLKDNLYYIFIDAKCIHHVTIIVGRIEESKF